MSGTSRRSNAAFRRTGLLVYQLGDGWEPLCGFLGVEAPQGTPFPHLNDAATFRSLMRTRLARTRAKPIAVILLGLAAARLGAVRRRLHEAARAEPP